MRGLFASEMRCIERIIQTRWGKANSHVPPIVSEYIAASDKSKSKPWFYCDFCVDFVDRRAADWANCKITSQSILPNTLGAELFLAVEPSEITPLRLELIGGQAFSIKHYDAYIQQAEEAIQRSLISQTAWPSPYPWREWLRLVSVKKSAFARMLVVEDDITFLYFPADTRPVMGGQLHRQVQAPGLPLQLPRPWRPFAVLPLYF